MEKHIIKIERLKILSFLIMMITIIIGIDYIGVN